MQMYKQKMCQIALEYIPSSGHIFEVDARGNVIKMTFAMDYKSHTDKTKVLWITADTHDDAKQKMFRDALESRDYLCRTTPSWIVKNPMIIW